MGSNWRIMPLLSTLAALVIIVHSAEEDLDREYRHDLRHRSFDTGTPTYDNLPWKVMEAEPAVRPSTQRDIWNDSPEDPSKRRRPVRKRKRHPLVSSEEVRHHENDSAEVRSYTDHPDDKRRDEPPRYHDRDEPDRQEYTEYSDQTTEMPRRRRKMPGNRRNRWAEEYPESDRPRRRRGQRRKRPSVSQSYLTELDDQPNVDQQDKEKPFPDNYEFDNNGERRETLYSEMPKDYVEPTNISEKPDESYAYAENPNYSLTPANPKVLRKYLEKTYDPVSNNSDTLTTKAPETLDTEGFSHYIEMPTKNSNQLKSDKSMSEFSLESSGPFHSTRHPSVYEVALGQKTVALPTTVQTENNKNMENRPIDPITLKEILKRSNGTSLSEILQQHNLSLSDLLYGKEEAISLIKSKGFMDKEQSSVPEKNSEEPRDGSFNQENGEERQTLQELGPEAELVTENETKNVEETTTKINDLESQSTKRETKGEEAKKTTQNTPKISNKRRFQNVRRKLRMRPAINNNYKGQLNRDLIALTARRYQNSRNAAKSKEWKYVIPLMNGTDASEENSTKEIVDKEETEPLTETTTARPEETTILHDAEYYNPSTIMIETQTEVTIKIDSEESDENNETSQAPMTTTQETTTTIITTTAKPRMSRLRPTANRMGLRRQAFNNRLKRKRQKQKNSTTESPTEPEEFGVDLFGMPNLVSSSEFIARTQTPKTTKSNDEDDDDFTTLEDFITTEKSRHEENGPRFTRNSTISESEPKSAPTIRFSTTTEETAKFEIEEILNDTRTSARLSRILMERNMTLNELVEHRERGSSHIHLADIFHNASKEPNPPEPFLSKSSIEPISKETYPLRAIIEANLHDPKGPTIEINPAHTQYINIPLVMDFGNNVNENGENMGIISLFNKFQDNDLSSLDNTEMGKDSEGTPYVTTVLAVNNTVNDTARESRVLKDQTSNLNHDLLGWNELFEIMRRSHENDTEQDAVPFEDSQADTKVMIPDADGDGVIVLEDLEHLRVIDRNVGSPSEENLDLNTYAREEIPVQPGILDRAPSHTRSVTVATASIVGLAMVLFLLTYAAFKWKQQRNMLHKKQSFSDERIPTPVFENRKSHKNNCSTRSISPMLATSNIYTMNTLDSNAGKESPDYMWDSLRKPFQ